MNRNHLKFLSSQLGGAKQRRRTNGTRRRSTFATASFILIVGLLAVLLAACPSASADTTPPTFTLSASPTEFAGVTELTIVASEPITLLGTVSDRISKLTVKTRVTNQGTGKDAPVTNVVLNNNDGKTVKLTVTTEDLLAVGEDVSVTITAGFAADKAATPNENVGATLTATVADTTPPTFTLSPISAIAPVGTLTITAKEEITLIGDHTALTITNDAGGTDTPIVPTAVALSRTTNSAVDNAVTITIPSTTKFTSAQKVSVAIEAGFVADTAAEPNNNVAATLTVTVSP